MADIQLLDEFGNLRTIDDSEAGPALAAGWRAPTPEEAQAEAERIQYSSLGEKLTGVGESALSGATLGLSDVALAELGGDEYRQARAARERQLGAIGTGAEIAGAIAPTLLTFGQSAPLSAAGVVRGVAAPVRAAAAVGRGAEALAGAGLRGIGITGESIIGRGVLSGTKLAAGGAAEGALFGAGQALSEAALAPGGDYDNLAEKIIAGGTTGAEFGALGGGLLGFAGGVGSRAIQRGAEKLAGPGGLKRMLEQTSDAAAGRALGMPRAPFGPQAGTEARIQRMVRTVKDATLDDGTRVMRLGDDQGQLADRVAIAEKQYGKRLGGIAKEADDAIETALASGSYRGSTNLRPDLTSFFGQVDNMVADAASGPPALARQMKRAAKELEPLRARFDAGDATLSDVLKYRQKLDKIIYPEKVSGALTVARQNAAELNAMTRELEGVVEQTIARAEDLVPGIGERYTSTKTAFGALKDAKRISAQEQRRAKGRNRFSPIETIAQVGGGVASIATGNALPLAASLAYSTARSQWTARGEQVLAIMADRAARSDRRIQQAVKGFFRKAGDTRRGVLAEGAAEEVETKGRIERTLRSRGSDSAKAYQKKLEKISRYNPETDQTLAEIAKVAPQTAIAYASRQTRAREHLLKTAPSDLLDGDLLQPQLAKSTPNRVLLERWARRIEMVEDPVATIEEGLAKGTLTREHVETLKLVDPTLYAQTQSRIMDELATSKVRPTYHQRIRLGILFQIPTDKSLRPAEMARTQRFYAQQRAIAAQPPPAAGAQGAPPGANTTAMQTASQRVESGAVPQ